jgi:hypothetical protein
MSRFLLTIPILFTVFGITDRSLAQALNIISESTSNSTPYPVNAIYPAFVDNTEYKSWTATGSFDHFQLKATGGNGSYAWSITNGSLPNGLILTSDGKIKGTPTTEGNFTFTAKVTSGSLFYTKQLTMKAAPYRAKWMTDAKFGIMIQWGAFTVPVISNSSQSDIYTFANIPSARIPLFSATAWVDSIKSIGAKVLNFTVKGGDGVRYWPDTSGSALNRKTQRDLVGELIAACHAGPNPIKFVAYVAPDHGWASVANRDYIGSPSPAGIGELNVKLIRELALKGVDGFWIDMGGTPELFPDVDPLYFPWDRILPIIRSCNPYLTFVANSGVSNGGTILHWPDTDIVNYENSQSWDPIVAFSNSASKKMAIEVNNLLDNQWAWLWPANNYGGIAKPSAQIIESIKKNWQVGATYILNYPVETNGNIFPSVYRQKLREIGNFVNANQGWSITPVASLAAGNYPVSQNITLSAPNASIYYTLDGTYPTENSSPYSSPILINKNTRVRAVAIEAGKGASRPLDIYYTIGTQNLEGFVKFASGLTGTEMIYDSAQIYRGIKFTVGHKSMLLQKLGRYFVSGNIGKHDLIIKRYHDEETLSLSTIDMSVGTADAEGFKYVDIQPVLLEAGKTYILASKENMHDKYINTAIPKFVLDKNIKNLSKINLNSTGGKKMVVQDGKGQVLNFKYQTEAYVDSANIALGAAAFLQSNSGASLPPSTYVMYAENAVDGDPETGAAADGHFAWTLHMDLGRLYRNINKVKLDFMPDRFATEFQILAQNNLGSWEVIYSKTNSNGISHNISFRARDIRYLRIRSLKPDGENQIGSQMVISKIGVYSDPNLAIGANVYLQDNSGYTANPSAGVGFAENAIDGNPATLAQAGGSWAWTLLTDLGRSYKKITRVKIDFGDSLYPTDYIVQVSADNVNWPDTAVIVKNNGVSPNTLNIHPDHWFSPTEGRYVRVRALKPYTSGQQGVQMAISELAIHESPNLAASEYSELSLQQNNSNPVSGSLQIPSSYTSVAENAIDTDLTTAAQAGNSWAWTLFTDLKKETAGINQISVNFLSSNFATEYKIFASVNGVNWTEVKYITGNVANYNVHNIPPFSARYIAVKALAPNGPNQTGIQMAIAEIGIYSDYVAANNQRTAAAELEVASSEGEFIVSPNPNNGDFNVAFDLTNSERAVLRVSDIQGKTWYKKQVRGKGIEKISLPGNLSGTFVIQLDSPNGLKVRKTIVVR